MHLKRELEREAGGDPILCIARESGQGFCDHVSVLLSGSKPDNEIN